MPIPPWVAVLVVIGVGKVVFDWLTKKPKTDEGAENTPHPPLPPPPGSEPSPSSPEPSPDATREQDSGGQTKKFYGRIKEGHTSSEEFLLPILHVVSEMGGSGDANQIIERVGALMETRLNALDRETLVGGTVRWRNSVATARYNMVHELKWLNPDAPYGIWEITAEGREQTKGWNPSEPDNPM